MLEAGHGEIIDDWVARTRADQRVPTRQLSDPALIDHVPALLAAIISRLLSGGTTVRSIERDVGRGPASHAHSVSRFDADYDVAAVIREFAHLRAAVLARLRAESVVMDQSTEELIHAALDEAIGTAAAEVARQQQALLQAIIAQSAEGIVAADADGRFRIYNEEAVRQHGIKRDDVAPTEWAQAYGLLSEAGDPLPLEQTPLYRAMHGERIPDARWQARRPDGSIRHLSGSATPLSLGSGSAVGAVLISRDDTERVLAERNSALLAHFSLVLARSLGGRDTVHQLLASMVPEFADYAMVDTVDAEGRFHRAGMAAAEGLTDFLRAAEKHVPSSAPESPVARVLAAREPMIVTEVTSEFLDALAGADREYRQVLEGIHAVSFLLLPLVVYERPIGVLKLISARASRRYEPGDLAVAAGLADRAALALDNARAYKEAEDRAERLRQEAEWRERFVAMLSHDLRTPLSAVQLTAQSLRRDARLPDSLREGVARIDRATARAARLISHLLDAARARNEEGIPIHRDESVDLREVCEEVVQEVSKVFPDRRVTIAVASECRGSWDADRVAQIVDNLVTNALRHSPSDTPVQIEMGLREGDRVFLRVRNEGEPIAADLVPTLFEPFKRGAANRPGKTGLGLGLYIASQVALAHRGELRLEYSDARGTSFVLEMPRV